MERELSDTIVCSFAIKILDLSTDCVICGEKVIVKKNRVGELGGESSGSKKRCSSYNRQWEGQMAVPAESYKTALVLRPLETHVSTTYSKHCLVRPAHQETLSPCPAPSFWQKEVPRLQCRKLYQLLPTQQ
jgi:hypothetical protein